MSDTDKQLSLPAGLTQEALDALKAKHKELKLAKYDDAAMIFRLPSPGEWERFQEKVDESPRNQYRAIKELLGACVVWPAPEPLEAIFQKRPAYVKRFGMVLVGFAGGEEATEKNDV